MTAKRQKNSLRDELDALVDSCCENKTAIDCTNTFPAANARRNAAWIQITDNINAVNRGIAVRKVEDVRKKWANLKAAVKEKYSALKQSRGATGGGGLEYEDLAEQEWKIVGFIGQDSVEGIPTGQEFGVGKPNLKGDQAEDEGQSDTHSHSPLLPDLHEYQGDNTSATPTSRTFRLSSTSTGTCMSDSLSRTRKRPPALKISPPYCKKQFAENGMSVSLLSSKLKCIS